MKEVGKIYSAVDADELEAGDIVCCGNAKSKLYYETVIENIRGDCEEYRFDTERNYYALAKLVCPKKHADVYKAWKNGAKVETFVSKTNEWVLQEYPPHWYEDHEYRVAEKQDRRLTNRELAKWLTQGNGQLKEGNNIFTCFSYSSEDEEEAREEVKVRKWNYAEWHEPTEGYCYG